MCGAHFAPAGGALLQTHENLKHLAACFAPAGDALFQTHENLEHLAMMEVVLGAIPAHMAAAADDNAAAYFRK